MRSANSADLTMRLCAEERTFRFDWSGTTDPAKTTRSRAQKVQSSTMPQALNSLLTRFPCLIAKFFAWAFPRDFAQVKGRLLTSLLVNRKEAPFRVLPALSSLPRSVFHSRLGEGRIRGLRVRLSDPGSISDESAGWLQDQPDSGICRIADCLSST